MEGYIYICIYIYIYVYKWQLRFESGIWFLGSFVLATYSIGSPLASHVATKYGFRSKRFTQQKPEPVTNSGKKNLSKQIWPLLDDLSIPMCHEIKKFVTKPPKGWSQTLLTESCNNLQRTQLCTLDHEPSKPAARWILLRSFRSLNCLFFSKLKTVFPIHFITQLWFATSSSGNQTPLHLSPIATSLAGSADPSG